VYCFLTRSILPDEEALLQELMVITEYPNTAWKLVAMGAMSENTYAEESISHNKRIEKPILEKQNLQVMKK
jgi:hypothetical protein